MRTSRKSPEHIWTLILFSSLVTAVALAPANRALARVVSEQRPIPGEGGDEGDGTPYEEPEEAPPDPDGGDKDRGDETPENGRHQQGRHPGKQRLDRYQMPIDVMLAQLIQWLRRV